MRSMLSVGAACSHKFYTDGIHMSIVTLRSPRLLIAFGGVLLILSLAGRFWEWLEKGVIDWPATVNTTGLLIIAAAGIQNSLEKRMQRAIAVIALALILPSSVIVITRFFSLK